MAIQNYICYGEAPYVWWGRLPDWVWDYKYVTIHNPNLGNSYLLAFNGMRRSYSSNITYGYIRTTYATNGVKCIYDGGWGEPTAIGSEWIWTSSPYVDHSYGPCWTNTDIYGWGSREDPNAEDYLARAATEPIELVIESGWTDYGSDGKISDLTNRNLTIYQGWSVAGSLRCRVNKSSADSFRFEWYEKGKLVFTQNFGTYSDYKPSSEKLGTSNIYCAVTALDSEGQPIQIPVYVMISWEYRDLVMTTPTVGVNVVAYDSGGNGSGGTPGDNIGSSGDITSSLVTDISLSVHPDTVVPGGHSTVEVTVNGTGNYSRAFTAQIGGHASSGTHLVKGGYSCNVWVAEDETADFVLVNVASVQDPTVTATEMIYIDHTGTEEEKTTEENLRLAFWKGFASFVVGMVNIVDPVMAEKDTWYQGTTDKGSITEINFVKDYTATGNETESWAADVDGNGSIMCYVNDTVLSICSMGAKKIMANEHSNVMFKYFTKVTAINGLAMLDTSNVTEMSAMFAFCSALRSLDLRSFNTSKVKRMENFVDECLSLTTLDLRSFDISNVLWMQEMFADAKALTVIYVGSGWNIPAYATRYDMFIGCGVSSVTYV